MISPTLGRRTFSTTLGRAAPSPSPFLSWASGPGVTTPRLRCAWHRGSNAGRHEVGWVQKPLVRGRQILVADFGWVDGVDGRVSLLWEVGRVVVRWEPHTQSFAGAMDLRAAGLIFRVRWGAAQAPG